MPIETDIIRHYAAQGVLPAPFDELHIGGRRATLDMLGDLGFTVSMKIIDVGSGLGGPARDVAETTGAFVQGIDLTPDFCTTAIELSTLKGWDARTAFTTANALAMPFDDAAFDGGYTIHVAMNIADKSGLYREIHRVLKPGSMFGIYDILQTGTAEMTYPMPWASAPATSFLVTLDAMRSFLTDAGFDMLSVKDCSAFAPKPGEVSTPDPAFTSKVENLARAIADGACAPWRIICRKM